MPENARYVYYINEFSVASEIPLPFDSVRRPPDEHDSENEITIRRASLANIPSLLRKVRRQLAYDVGDGFLIEPRIGIALHVDYKGRTITIDAEGELLPVAIAWLIHAGFGGTTLLRGGLPLHGAGLEWDEKRFCLMAESGSGKSTLSWRLLQQGARFANDDLIPVYWSDESDESASAYPSISLYPKLSRDMVDYYGLTPAELLPAEYGNGEEEYFAPLLAEQRAVAPRSLSAAFLLRPVIVGCGNDCGGNCGGECACQSQDFAPNEVVLRRLPPDEATRTLLANLHAHWIIGKWLDERKIRRLCSRLAAQVPIYTLSYVRSHNILPELERIIRLCLTESDDAGRR